MRDPGPQPPARPLDARAGVCRAVGLPATSTGPAAIHAADYLSESLGFVLGKRVGAPAGTTLVLEIPGHPAYGFEVGDDGGGCLLARAARRPDGPHRAPTARRSSCSPAACRARPTPGAVRLEGDTALGEQVVASMAVTP